MLSFVHDISLTTTCILSVTDVLRDSNINSNMDTEEGTWGGGGGGGGVE